MSCIFLVLRFRKLDFFGGIKINKIKVINENQAMNTYVFKLFSISIYCYRDNNKSVNKLTPPLSIRNV
jgi:hypothetical protein